MRFAGTEGPHNEEMQQKTPAFFLDCAGFAADLRCSADVCDTPTASIAASGRPRRRSGVASAAPLAGSYHSRPRTTVRGSKTTVHAQERQPALSSFVFEGSEEDQRALARAADLEGTATAVSVHGHVLTRRGVCETTPSSSQAPRGRSSSQRRFSPSGNRPRAQPERAAGSMIHLDGLAGVGASLWLVGLPNEALQQTKPGVTTHGPVFAAERRCYADLVTPVPSS